MSAFANPIWKERSCPWCGCVYRGLIPQAQTDAAVAAAVHSGRTLTALLAGAKSTAISLPCPGCGARPHYSVAAWRCGFHFAIVGFSVAAAVLLGLAAVNKWLSGENFYFVAAAVVAAAGFLHLVAWNWNPNLDRAGQQRRGESAVEDGRMALVVGPMRSPEQPKYPSWPSLALPCALISAVAPASAVLLLGVEKPPTIAQTVQVREVVKAGDTDVAASWDGGFKSVSGRYRTKTGKVTLLNAKALGISPDVRYVLHNDNWDGGNRVEDEGDLPPRIEVILAIPNDPKVKGRTLEFRAELTVIYPVRVNATQFDDVTREYSHDFRIRVATDAEVAAVNKFNKAGFAVVGMNILGFLAGALVAMAAVGAWNPGDTGLPVAD
jgi:hypothetical protein